MKRVIGWFLCWIMSAPISFAQYTVPYPSHKKASGGGGTITAYCNYTTSNAGSTDPFTWAGLSGHASSANDLIVLGITTSNNNAASLTVTDDQSQTYGNQSGALLQTNASGRAGIWYFYASASGVTTFTVAGQGFTGVSMSVCKVTGAKYATDPFDVSAKAESTYGASTWSSGATSAVAQASEFFFAVDLNVGFPGSGTFSANAPLTGIGGDTGKQAYSAYAIMTSASGAYTASGNAPASSYQDAVFATFKGQ